MTHNDPGWLNMAQDDIPGVRGAPGGSGGRQGAPGGSTQPPAAKRVIKTAKNGPKPRFKVSKVYPDPKRMVLIHFWGIWGLLDDLQQQYLVKTSICQKPSLREKITQRKSQTTRCNFWMVWHFSIPPRVPRRYGKMPNHSKIAPSGLGLSLYKSLIFSEFPISLFKPL